MHNIILLLLLFSSIIQYVISQQPPPTFTIRNAFNNDILSGTGVAVYEGQSIVYQVDGIGIATQLYINNQLIKLDTTSYSIIEPIGEDIYDIVTLQKIPLQDIPVYGTPITIRLQYGPESSLSITTTFYVVARCDYLAYFDINQPSTICGYGNNCYPSGYFTSQSTPACGCKLSFDSIIPGSLDCSTNATHSYRPYFHTTLDDDLIPIHYNSQGAMVLYGGQNILTFITDEINVMHQDYLVNLVLRDVEVDGDGIYVAAPLVPSTLSFMTPINSRIK